MNSDANELRYLRLLSEKYPSIQAASAAIIKLTANLNLPKGTEHFISDIHGEFEAFRHVLKNASGSIKRKIEENFPSLSESERRIFATLIYYPEEKLPLILRTADDEASWYRSTVQQLIKLCRIVSSKYTRADVRKLLPDDFTDLIDELLHQQREITDKTDYYQSIIDTIIVTGSAKAFVVALAKLIQRLAIARLHIIGDIYDRGPGAHLIMDALMAYHNVDIQWGNHDILWMAAAGGCEAAMANVIRVCLRYANMETLENGYAVSLLPLASFALDTYGNDSCERFMPRVSGDEVFTEQELRLMAVMHKAITIIQFKLEGQIIKRHPHYQMDDRLLLEKVNYEAAEITLGDTTHPLLDTNFPTVDSKSPYRLTDAEQNVIEKLKLSFANSKRLQRHVRFLYSKGSIYLVYNGNLLYHGCIAMNEDSSFQEFAVGNKLFAAREFMDRVDRLARQGYFSTDDPERKQYGLDAMWYLWSGPQSPIFGKDKMATFERYFIADKTTHAEKQNAYYSFNDREETARKILMEFGLDPETAHIINGHVPVKAKRGESPVKAGGKLLVIDGGFSKAYQRQTGIAGYTLVSNSFGLLLAAHHPFVSAQKAVEDELDIKSDTEVLETITTRMRVGDTDEGREMQQKIEYLHLLLKAYRTGLIKEC